MGFPKDFVWGAATSAIQIEGFPTADGGGESVWDAFCRKEGAISGGEDSQIACDSYHRYGEDLDLLQELGLKHYRFSISWARVDPQGTGDWNEAGIGYYDALVDACLSRGITPWVTLHHWELPLALEQRGGWLNPDTAAAFGRFAGRMARQLGDRVQNWFTLNEPECVLLLGYSQGVHAPGKQLHRSDVFTCWKHMLMAHGAAGRALRAQCPEAVIGIVSTGRLCYPKTEADTEAARQETFVLYDDDWLFSHNLVLEPAVFGRLNTTPGTALHALASAVTPEEWAAMQFVPDVIGLNVYNGHEITAGPQGEAVYTARCPGFPRTALKWPVTPRIMNDSLRFLQERYGKPLYITECGLSCNDWIHLDGCIHDPDRIDFLHRYLSALQQGCEATDVRGFFQWSLLDNFEWHSGYSERFGLVYVDFPTGTRTLKDSALWYARTAAENGAGL